MRVTLLAFSPPRDKVMSKGYRHLTYEQRCHIYILKKSGFTQRAIADTIGCSQPTISRELTRNQGQRGYRAKQAQMLAETRREASCQPTKRVPELLDLVDEKIRLEWSPDQVSNWLLNNEGISISHETIYLHIWADKRQGGDLYLSLRRKSKKYNKRSQSMTSRGKIKNARSIDDRPSIVDDYARVGDWEIDTIIGKGHKGALVTIVERKTKLTLSAQVNHKSADAVTQATVKLLKPYQHVVHTITADNGKEFSGHEEISKALSADVYFAHPYSSWERGLNENTNGLIRQYFPKETDFRKVKQEDVDFVLERLNTRPRKILGYKTPEQVMSDYLNQMAA